jgi:excisionase family DNA binding protein
LKPEATLWHYRTMSEPDYLTPEQVAEKLQMNARVVRRMLSAGKLPGKRVGRIWRVSSAALRAYIEDGEKPAAKGE